MRSDYKPLDTRKTYLITGAAGFIGYHVSKRLLEEGCTVIGLDNMNDYYDVNLKFSRLAMLQVFKGFKFVLADLQDKGALDQLFQEQSIEIVVNLAAQAGVRYSLENPDAYIQSNIVGFLNILEACRRYKVDHLLYASSSSVYGMNVQMPFSTHQNVDHPISLYAATKKSNELMAHSYSYLYQIPTTGLRFFTVYGPWGRPDMALFLFTEAILQGKKIQVFNGGNMKRDFTYIDTIVDAVIRLLENPPKENPDWDKALADPSSSAAPYKIYNIGSNKPIELLRFIEILEDKIGKKAQIIKLPMQAGDVQMTYAEVEDLVQDIGFKLEISMEEGIEAFVKWYKGYYLGSEKF